MNATANRQSRTDYALTNASPRQREFIADLLRAVPLDIQLKASMWVSDNLNATGEPLTHKQVHNLIDHLIKVRDAQRASQAEAPATRPAGQKYPDVEAGRYALTIDGEVRFYRVQRPQKGKFIGRTFLSSQHGDNHTRLFGAHAVGILRQIEQDPEAAHNLYCDELGVCRKCTRTLTDQVSRDRHFGPDCWAALNS